MPNLKTYTIRGYTECILTTEILASSREEADEIYRSKGLECEFGSSRIELDAPYTIDIILEEGESYIPPEKVNKPEPRGSINPHPASEDVPF